MNSSKNSLWERTECKPYFNYNLLTARERLQDFSCDSIATITMINISKRIQVKLITVINSSVQKGTFAGFFLLRITLIQRGFPFDSSGMCIPVEKHLYTKGKNKWICMSECVYTKQNVKSKIIFRFKSGDLSAKRISHFLFLLLRFPHSPALSIFSSFFVIKDGEQHFHLPVCVRWMNQYIGFELPKYTFY